MLSFSSYISPYLGGYNSPATQKALNDLPTIEKQIAQDPTSEIAINALMVDVIEAFDTGISPYHGRSEILNKKSFAEAYRTEKDPQIQACLKLFKLSVLQLEMQVKSAIPDDPIAEELAEFTRYLLSDQCWDGTLSQSLYKVLSAIFYGYSISEKKLEYEENGRWKNKLVIRKLKGKKPGMYGFKLNEFDDILAIRNLYTLQLYPKGKFFIYSCMNDDENPYGNALFDVVYPFQYAKKELLKLLVIYLIKYSAPTLDVIMKDNTDAAKAEADKIIKVFQTTSGIRHTDDLELKLLEASKSGQNPYIEAINILDKQMAQAILSSVLSTNEGTNGTGSYAQSKVHQSVTKVLIEYLAKTLADAIYQQIVIPLLQWNFDQNKYPREKYPTICFESTEKEDIKLWAEVFKILHEIGYIDNDEFDSEMVRLKCQIPPKPKEEFEETEIEEPEEIEDETDLTEEEKMSMLKRMYKFFFKEKVKVINYDKVA